MNLLQSRPASPRPHSPRAPPRLALTALTALTASPWLAAKKPFSSLVNTSREMQRKLLSVTVLAEALRGVSASKASSPKL
jgi:hypothetical protein